MMWKITFSIITLGMREWLAFFLFLNLIGVRQMGVAVWSPAISIFFLLAHDIGGLKLKLWLSITKELIRKSRCLYVCQCVWFKVCEAFVSSFSSTNKHKDTIMPEKYTGSYFKSCLVFQYKSSCNLRFIFVKLMSPSWFFFCLLSFVTSPVK